jgi:hypothetical protein
MGSKSGKEEKRERMAGRRVRDGIAKVVLQSTGERA